MSDLLIRKTATISKDGLYRTRLTRYWGPGPMMPWCMLNPSKADAEIDDPTVGRVMFFSRREGAGGSVIENAYSFRSTNPKELVTAGNPFGPSNHDALFNLALEAVANNMPIVCAWGASGPLHAIPTVLKIFEDAGARLVCLGTTKDGHPRHPLYVRGNQPFIEFP